MGTDRKMPSPNDRDRPGNATLGRPRLYRGPSQLAGPSADVSRHWRIWFPRTWVERRGDTKLRRIVVARTWRGVQSVVTASEADHTPAGVAVDWRRRLMILWCRNRMPRGVVLGVCALVVSCAAQAQQAQPLKQTDLPNPYRLVEGWPMLPANLNGGRWGEVSRVQVGPRGNIWVLHRCFADKPPGSAVCLGAFKDYPPILEFDPGGQLLAGLGIGLLAYPHGLAVDREGNPWVTDVNDAARVLGRPATNTDGVVMGQDVLKLDPTGKVLLTLGKEGVSGIGDDTFDRPSGVAVAANGDVFVSDGHYPNAHHNARIMKFDKKGHFIKSWGKLGSAPGDFDGPHDLCIGGSQQHVFVADRQNKRIQVFDQDGQFIAAWPQFGQVNSVFVGKDDTIYAGTAYPDPAYVGKAQDDPTATSGLIRGIIVGSAKDGTLKAFIPDPTDLTTVVRGSSASGITADDHGNIYAADVGAHSLRKYTLQSNH
jgi:hypothetical protein